MKFIVIHTSNLNWRITEKDKSEIPFLAFEGYSILNPVKYSKEYKECNFLTGLLKHIKGEYIITTTGLILKCSLNEMIDHQAVFSHLSNFFRYLKFESMQGEIKINNSISALYEKDKLKKGKIDFEDTSTIYLNAQYYNTMIKWRHVKIADKRIFKKVKIAVSEEILIDAFNFLRQQEYDKTILFSAIAIESFLANLYDEIYARSILKSPKKIQFRFKKNSDGSYKDPIFKSLVDRTDFKKLLHEVPLYLINKSILLENEKLFLNLVKLYNTRNKIVHWGAPLEEDETKRIIINQKGAILSFNLAVAVFTWGGANRYNILINEGFIQI